MAAGPARVLRISLGLFGFPILVLDSARAATVPRQVSGPRPGRLVCSAEGTDMAIGTYVDNGKHGRRANQLLCRAADGAQAGGLLRGSNSSHSKAIEHHRVLDLTQSPRVPLLCATSVLE